MNNERYRWRFHWGGKIKNIARNFSNQTLFDNPAEQISEIGVNIADISWTGVDTASFVLTEALTC